jgi:hypothetical protein
MTEPTDPRAADGVLVAEDFAERRALSRAFMEGIERVGRITDRLLSGEPLTLADILDMRAEIAKASEAGRAFALSLRDVPSSPVEN